MRQLDGSTTFSNFDSPGIIPDGHTFFTAPFRVLFYLGGTITHSTRVECVIVLGTSNS